MRLNAALLVLCLIPLFAHAHDSGTAKARFESQTSGEVSVRIDLRAEDLKQLLAGPEAKPAAVEPVPSSLFFMLTAGEQPCPAGPMTVSPLGIQGVRLTGQLHCTGTGPLQIRWHVARSSKLGLECILTLVGPDKTERIGLLTASASVLSASTGDTGLESSAGLFGRFLSHGAVHILTGWDHLAFLLVLLLGCGSWRRLATLITGFTVAHSVTLALGATGWVVVSSSIVEPLIAASIAATACFALWQLARGRLEAPGSPVHSSAIPMLLVCMSFGLVHGLGFAGLLEEMLSTTSARLVPLAAFNIGVELGQLGCVVVVFPLLIGLGKTRVALPTYASLLAGLLSLGAAVTAMRVLG